MALTSETTTDKIEVVGPYNHVQVRQVEITKENETEVSRSFHRRVISPTDDTSGESQEIQEICAVAHTQEVKDAFSALEA